MEKRVETRAVSAPDPKSVLSAVELDGELGNARRGSEKGGANEKLLRSKIFFR